MGWMKKRTVELPNPDAPLILEDEHHWRLTGPVVLDLQRSERSLVTELEPDADIKAADLWGGFMDGTLELTDEGVIWVPSVHSRKFGFDAFRLDPETVADIHVAALPGGRGDVDIDLTDHRRVSVKVRDPELWQEALDKAIGA